MCSDRYSGERRPARWIHSFYGSLAYLVGLPSWLPTVSHVMLDLYNNSSNWAAYSCWHASPPSITTVTVVANNFSGRKVCHKQVDNGYGIVCGMNFLQILLVNNGVLKMINYLDNCM